MSCRKEMPANSSTRSVESGSSRWLRVGRREGLAGGEALESCVWMAVPSVVKKPLELDFGVVVDNARPERSFDICAGNKLGVVVAVEATPGCCSVGFENRLPNSAAAPLCGVAAPFSPVKPIGDDADRLCPAEATLRSWPPVLAGIVDSLFGEVSILSEREDPL